MKINRDMWSGLGCCLVAPVCSWVLLGAPGALCMGSYCVPPACFWCYWVRLRCFWVLLRTPMVLLGAPRVLWVFFGDSWVLLFFLTPW